MHIFKRHFGLFEILLVVVLIFIFYYLTFIIKTDIPDHARILRHYLADKGPFPVNFLYYFSVYLLSFFSADNAVLLVVSVYMLVTATFFKYYIVKRLIYSELHKHFRNINFLSTISSFLLIFAFSLPSLVIFKGLYYKFNFPPNVWHNSTTIFVMPFVVLLFWISVKQLKDFKSKRLILILVLTVLNTLVKPSFLFVYFLAYPILLFKKYWFSRFFWINLLPIVVAVLLIIIQYFFIYIQGITGHNTSVAIGLFYIYNHTNIELSWYHILIIYTSTLISSFLFPIVLLFRNKELWKVEMVQFAVLCVFFGQIISVTFYETGERAMHGNFLWQNFMASFILFFVCVLQLLKLISGDHNWKKYQMETFILGLHFLSGLVYFSKIIATDAYA